MSFKVLASKAAAALDKELMTSGGFTLDQLVCLPPKSCPRQAAIRH